MAGPADGGQSVTPTGLLEWVRRLADHGNATRMTWKCEPTGRRTREAPVLAFARSSVRTDYRLSESCPRVLPRMATSANEMAVYQPAAGRCRDDLVVAAASSPVTSSFSEVGPFALRWEGVDGMLASIRVSAATA
jgi:hypothetical protein